MDAVRRLTEQVVFEVIPMKNTLEQARLLPPGALVSVTASPAKGMEATVGLVEQLAEHGYRAIPHLSARLTRSRSELKEIVRRLELAGITRVFVVGGDGEAQGEFFDAMALLRAISEMGHPFTEVGVTGYPEGHPMIPEATLAQSLLDKQVLASHVTTQMCFDIDRIGAWIRDRRAQGVRLPVVVGLPGAVDTVKLMTIGARIGVGTSLKYLAKNRRTVAKLIKPGHFTPDDLLTDLAPLAANPEMGIVGLHVFTFNQVEGTLEWLEGLSTM